MRTSPRTVLLTLGLTLTLTLTIGCGKEDSSTAGSSESGGGTSETGAGETTVQPTGSTSAATSEGSGEATAAGSSSSSSSGGDCVTGFICTPDGGGQPAECSVFEQDCKEGEKCVAYGEGGGSAWNATKCVPITGDGVPGDDCTAPEGGLAANDDCGAGAFCWDVLNNHGICVALCKGNADAPICEQGTTCLISNGGVLNLCLTSCDPLIQDCPGDDLCVPSGMGFLCSQDASGDGGQTNDPCQGGNVCDKGLLCLDTPTASSACDAGSTGCCQPYCTFPDDPCPNPDQKCVQWFNPDELPPGDPQLDIGVCGIPQ